MSGVAGADRVKSRQDFAQFLASYKDLISQFPGFVSLNPSGSYNSNPDKMDFGDIDLIVHIKSNKDKAAVKKDLQAFFHAQPETRIVPFSSQKHAGKRSYNAGELVSVRYHDDALGYSAQIDNIVALDQIEMSFKQHFLDMPAEKQGLVLGLVKIATIETDPAVLFKRLGISVPIENRPDQEYEFNLSSVKLELRKVIYEPGTFKQIDREVLWSSQRWEDLEKLLYQYDLDQSFDELLAKSKSVIKNPRSNQRMQGVFASMITVKSGEVGTAKGAGKEAALDKIRKTFSENRRQVRLFNALLENNNSTVVFAFGRFQPPTAGHELVISAAKTEAQQNQSPYAIFVSKTQDNKKNPLTIEQKMHYLSSMFPGTSFVACDAAIRTPIEAAKHLNQKYKNLIMIAGSDRAAAFEKLLNDYNGKEYQFDDIKVVSSGERDPDADDVSAVSGTALRDAAVAGDYETFKHGLPASADDQTAQQLMTDIQTGMTKKKKAKEGDGYADNGSPESHRAGIGNASYVSMPGGIGIKEGMSAAARLQKALQREKEKGDYSRRYAEKHFPIGKPKEEPKKEKDVEEDANKKCPPATQDITLNLKNRQKAIDEYGYGPLNPDMPNRKFWMKKVDEWNLDSVEEAKSSLCGNCAAFDQRKDTLDCIAQGIGSDAGEADPTIEAGDLGYCRFLKFKCAARRTCDAWVTGGPLRDESDAAEEGYGNHPSQRVDPRTGKRYVPPKSPLGQGVAEGGAKYKVRSIGQDRKGEYYVSPSTGEKVYKKAKVGDHEVPGSKEIKPKVEGIHSPAQQAAIALSKKEKQTDEDQRLDPKCWKGYKKQGTKMKGGNRVNNCVPVSEDIERIMAGYIKILSNK